MTGYMYYPDADSAQTYLDILCVDKGYGPHASYTMVIQQSTTCFCWDSVGWYRNCCGGQAPRELVTSVTCKAPDESYAFGARDSNACAVNTHTRVDSDGCAAACAAYDRTVMMTTIDGAVSSPSVPHGCIMDWYVTDTHSERCYYNTDTSGGIDESQKRFCVVLCNVPPPAPPPPLLTGGTWEELYTHTLCHDSSMGWGGGTLPQVTFTPGMSPEECQAAIQAVGCTGVTHWPQGSRCHGIL